MAGIYDRDLQKAWNDTIIKVVTVLKDFQVFQCKISLQGFKGVF